MRSMSKASILIKLLMASSLILLPIPLHFQETTFIIYVSGGLLWSLVIGFSPSLVLLLIASQGLARCPEAYLCTFPALFFPDLSFSLLWISLLRLGILLFPLLPPSLLILALHPQLLRCFLWSSLQHLSPWEKKRGCLLQGRLFFES